MLIGSVSYFFFIYLDITQQTSKNLALRFFFFNALQDNSFSYQGFFLFYHNWMFHRIFNGGTRIIISDNDNDDEKPTKYEKLI